MTKTAYPTTHYDLTDLRVFVAIAEEGSVTNGAARCHLAPSTASLRLKDLETAVGATLLRRNGRGIELAPAGQVLLSHARRCLAQIEQMKVELLPFAQRLSANLNIYANNNAISSYLADDLSRFFAAYPAARINLKERLSTEIMAAVTQGEADLGVMAVDSRHEALMYWPYRVDRLVLLVPETHTLATRKSVSFSECLGDPFVCLQQSAALQIFLANKAITLGTRMDIRVQMSDYYAIAHLVSAGAGLAVVPRSVLQAIEARGVATIEMIDPWASRELYLCVRVRPTHLES
jgi:DNA-binding transcriptional LysR family regulator